MPTNFITLNFYIYFRIKYALIIFPIEMNCDFYTFSGCTHNYRQVMVIKLYPCCSNEIEFLFWISIESQLIRVFYYYKFLFSLLSFFIPPVIYKNKSTLLSKKFLQLTNCQNFLKYEKL